MPHGDLTPEQEYELVDRLIAGQAGSWEDFLLHFQGGISFCVRRAGVSDDDHEDACAFVLESLFADGCRRLLLWEGRNGARLSTYLHAVSLNLARDYLRNLPRDVTHRAPEAEIPDNDPEADAILGPEARALQSQLRYAILECLFRMPTPADREILLFHYHAGLPPGEIARLSGRTRNSVDQALSRARRNLREVAEISHPELLEFLGDNRRGA